MKLALQFGEMFQSYHMNALYWIDVLIRMRYVTMFACVMMAFQTMKVSVSEVRDSHFTL